jgi:predicted glycosyltransferase involved in capsule biosynthesis
MKPLLIFPLLAFLYNLPAPTKDFKIETKDTVYIYTNTPPHNCNFPCPLKGYTFFYQSDKENISYGFNKMHFYHPEKTALEYYKEWLEQSKHPSI